MNINTTILWNFQNFFARWGDVTRPTLCIAALTKFSDHSIFPDLIQAVNLNGWLLENSCKGYVHASRVVFHFLVIARTCRDVEAVILPVYEMLYRSIVRLDCKAICRFLFVHNFSDF